MRKILPQVIALLLFANLSAQDDALMIRTIDGTNNNLSNPTWGSAGENLFRFTDVGYSDGISSPGGIDRPNPRNVSNILFAQDGLNNDVQGLSDFCWVFGQFLDHDLGITPDGNEVAFIEVPRGDEWFDPAREGRAIIPMMRNLFDPASGTDSDNPRQHPNLITAFIDGSAVYGSEEERAHWLRTFEGGKLKTSAGDLLPYNTLTGELDGEIDPHAPENDNPVGLTDKIFVAGDVRSNENPLLAAFHTLFVREHNRLCDELIAENPDWGDEQIYQHARKIVGGLIQRIVYYEWLPTMGVQLPEYQGYDPSVNPQLMNVFTAAAFRLGHTLLNGNIMRLDENGEVLPEGNLSLRDAFFNPFALPETGLDPFLRGMAVQTQQGMDSKVIDDVRNFLFGAPGAGGLDLAAININRGRERGLPDFNTVRKNFGLSEYRVFPQINSDINVHARLFVLYRGINWIDPWVGMLAEKPLPNSLFGETINKIMEVQFLALRDGDRFYFENDPMLSDEEIQAIKETKFRDIIVRNTGIELMQSNVFRATEMENICPVMSEFVVNVNKENDEAIEGVTANLNMDDGEIKQGLSTEDGSMVFENMTSCEMIGFQLNKDDFANNGVSTADIILLQREILGIPTFTSPYQFIAADVNNSGSITTLDMINMRNVVLLKDKEFPGGVVWTFIPADYEFENPNNPFQENYPKDAMVFNDAPEVEYSFVGVKKGDINGSVQSSSLSSVEPRDFQPIAVSIQDMNLVEGNTYEVSINVNELSKLQGFQFGLNFDPEAVQIQQVANQVTNLPGLGGDNFAVYQDEGLLLTSWNTFLETEEATGTFSISFSATRSGNLSEFFSLNYNRAKPEAYLHNTTRNIELEIEPSQDVDQFLVYQNEPNPFKQQTQVRFNLPKASQVTLTLFDASGKQILRREQSFSRGINTWTIKREEVSTSGLFYYEIATQDQAITKKMTIIN